MRNPIIIPLNIDSEFTCNWVVEGVVAQVVRSDDVVQLAHQFFALFVRNASGFHAGGAAALAMHNH